MYLYSYDNLSRIAKTEKGREYVEKVRECYEKEYANKPILALTYSKFKLFRKTGDRTQFQLEYFDRRKRFMLLQVLAVFDDKYLEPLEDIMAAICDEFCWTIPAHCPIWDKEGEHDYTQVDLFNAETGFYLAETAYIFGDKLSIDLRNRIKLSLKRQIIDNYESRTFGFDTMKNNWATVCSCGIGLTYLYAFPERFKIVKDRIFTAMERYINNLDPDGYCSEGFSYWVYGFGFFTLFFDVYCQLTGERPAILDSERVKNTIKYAQNAVLEGGVFLPISDGGMTNEHAEENTLSVINRVFNVSVKIGNGRAVKPDTQVLGLRCLYSTSVVPPESKVEKGGVFFEKSQVLVVKKDGYDFISKGGNNAEMHNHNDIGAFSIFRKGVQYIVDPGAGEYTSGYFNDPTIRYSEKTFTCSSLGHSVPIIDGQVQDYGKDYFSTVLDRTDSSITYDLSTAYPKKLDKFTVTYGYEDNKVTASYSLKGLEKGATFRFISSIEPKIDSDGVLIKEMKITCDKKALPEVSVINYSSHGAIPKTAYAIDYSFNGDIDVSFNFDF